MSSPTIVHKTTDARPSPFKLGSIAERFGLAIVLFILMGILAILSPEFFLSRTNLTNVARQISVNALLALGEFLVILTAGIDLSVGAIMALSMIMMALSSHGLFDWYAGYYASQSATFLPDPQSTTFMVLLSILAIFIGIAVGSFFGLLNGWGTTKLRLPHPFIATLGMLNIARGATDLISGGAPITGVPKPMRFFGAGNILLFKDNTGDWVQIPIALILVIITFIIIWFFLAHTRTGRHIYAVGGNPQSALYAGVNVDRVLNIVYCLSGFMAAMAALVLAGRTNSGYPKAGTGAELDAIAAVIIGGASFFGGRGTVIGTFIGVLIMGFIRNGLNLLNVSVFWQEVAIGAIIVIAAYIDVIRRRAAKLSE
jgi:ribose/xylose/arabinose/galactoside ABC-type transport system permease subunit